ncbi:TonB-dependent siderophore receptor [Desulfopila sp. IMCC35008]|uniref:TonB-dependent receptor plug domain-containing protein n=1 Tax=Desulfopila sp. IMCC35008 TaxID=2653858 RepID=UPI0013D06159|nr:TonB-dependent receptor [Desulfopila sp. IMCC35008]
MKCSLFILRVLPLWMLLATTPIHGLAEVQDLDDFSLEDLGTVGLANAPRSVTASTAARVLQTTASSPSAVRIVTAEDIKTYGYRTLEDILRSLPGLYTTSDDFNTFLGVRGLGRPGDYNTRVLILIDGVRVNDNIYDSALAGREFPLDVGLIERLEYAPGPGSAVYGKNAFFGVVNVITKNGHSYNGFELAGGVGSFDSHKLRLTYGDRYDNGAEVLLSMTGFKEAGVAPSYSEESAEYDSDFTENGTFLAKFSYDSFQAEVVYGTRRRGAHVYPETGLINEYDENRDERLIIDTRYATTLSDTWALEINATYNEALYRGSFPYIDYEESGEREIFVENSPGRWLSGGFQVVNTQFENHRILFGVEGHADLELRSEGGLEGSELDYSDEDEFRSYGVYIQDDISLSKGLTLLLGGRFDETEFGSKTNPRIGLIWQPRADRSVKLLYGSAFRTPNFFEASSLFGTEDEGSLDFEEIQTAEFVLEYYLNPSTRFSGAFYYYQIDDVIEEVFADDDYTFRNSGSIDALGVEFEAETRFSNGIRVDVSYAVQESEKENGQGLSNSPTHQLKMRSSIPLGYKNSRLGAEVQYISERMGTNGVELNSYWLGNLTVTAELNDDIDLSASIYNVGDVTYSDPYRLMEEEATGTPQEGWSFFVQMDVRFELW